MDVSKKMEIVLLRHKKTKKWLSEQWGIKPPSMSQKFRENNWRESDIKKFCGILDIKYNIIFEDNGENI